MGEGPPTVHVISAGVDWLTATAPADGRDMGLLLSAEGAFEDERKAGERDERSRWRQYDLKQCGQVSAGVREDGALVRLSGESAHEHWRSVARRAVNISRLDLEVTVRMAPPDPELAARTLADARFWRAGRPNPPKVAYHGTPEQIQTVYIGSRASERYGRLYDKHAESEDERWADCWRYEVEYKGALARHIATRLASSRDDGRAAVMFVHHYFETRGCNPVFQRDNGDVRVPLPRARTTDQTRLKWLEESVSPVVMKLTDHGHRADIIRCLGLQDETWNMTPEERQKGGD